MTCGRSALGCSDRSALRVLIAAAGSGGHLFPAQTLARSLLQQRVEVHFAGTGLSANPFFGRQFAHLDVESPKLSANPLKFCGVLRGWRRGLVQATRLLKSYRPHLVLGFGSFHTAAVLLASAWQRIPFLLHEANAQPGKVVRLFAPWARETGAHFASLTRGVTLSKCAWISLPLRWNSTAEGIPERGALFDALGLSPQRQLLLVLGGSQGASFLNEKVPEALASCRRVKQHMQVLHLAGHRGDVGAIEARYRRGGISARVRPFEENMHWAWTAADSAVARAGSSTLMEMAHFKVPTLLIPYPGAGHHQLFNAQSAVEEIGGAICVPQARATQARLRADLEALVAPSSALKAHLLANLEIYSKRPKPIALTEWVLRHLRELRA